MDLEEEVDYLRNRVSELEALLSRQAGDDPFRRVVESAPYGMVVSDAQGRIVMVNPQAEAMFGYSAESFLERHIEDLVPPQFRGGHAAKREGFHGSPTPRSMGEGRDLYACRSDGSEFPVEIALTPLVCSGETLTLSGGSATRKTCGVTRAGSSASIQSWKVLPRSPRTIFRSRCGRSE